MAYGRKTGGRKKGTPNKVSKPRTQRIYDLEQAVAENKLLPVPYMLQVLNHPDSKPLERAWAAEKAAPYIHPRLAPVDPKTGESPILKIHVMAWQGPRQPQKR